MHVPAGAHTTPPCAGCVVELTVNAPADPAVSLASTFTAAEGACGGTITASFSAIGEVPVRGPFTVTATLAAAVCPIGSVTVYVNASLPLNPSFAT